MAKKKHGGFYLMMCFIMGFIILCGFTIYAKAAEVTLPDKYSFVYNGKNNDTGSELELKQLESLLSVTAVTNNQNTWATDANVTWVSSEKGVIAIDTNTGYGPNFVKLIRKGPGYSTITAVIKQGTYSMTISCRVKVALQYDYGKIGISQATTTNDRILTMDMGDPKHKLYLKYTDYSANPTDTTTASGDAITASLVDWTSSNPGVATVDSDGNVTAVGSGTTDITVTTNTVSSTDNSLSATLRVVVAPKFSITYGPEATPTVANSVDKENKVASGGTALGVPSSFTVASNATKATNLTWKVVDFSTGNPISKSDTSKMSYTISQGNGNVVFSNVKAGTYDIYAFADSSYNTLTSNVPYAYLRVVVPFDYGDTNIIMSVNDTYKLLDNSNIPAVSDFSYTYMQGNENIVLFDQNTGTFTARSKGTIKISLRYATGKKLYDNASVIVPDQIITITVIDGIAISMTNAKIYVKGTLLLEALTTDSTNPVAWSSSDTSVATVSGGLVTGVKAGTARITVKQTVNGVVKSATCVITVQPSVSTITIDPSSVTLAIDAYKTLHATITPTNLNGISLQWKTSDSSVVDIVESSALTTTIQAKDGGHAVICAINQDNVVVGYCHVTVKKSVESIKLSATTVSALLSSKQYQLTATVSPDTAVNKTVNWESTDSTKAKVDAYGMVTFVSTGTVSIIATSADNPSLKAICNINITVPVTSVSLNEKAKTMYVGQTAKLLFTVLPATAGTSAVTFTSTNTSVATVDATGKITAKSVGTTIIILKSVEGGYTSFCTVTVKSVASGIKLDKTEVKLKAGEYAYLKATLTPKNSTENELVWESSDTKVAMVDGDGKVTAKKAGVAIISARTQTGAVSFCTVTVTEGVAGLILNYTDKTIYKGGRFELKASVNPSTATNLAVVWTSSNTKVATIDNRGEVKGIQGGTTVISCKTVDGGYQATCVVTVRELVTTVTLNHSSLGIGKGKAVMLIATATTETASNHNVTWKSSNRKVVYVSKKGKVTALSNGHATITAIAKDGSEAEASCYVRVVNPVTSLTLNKGYMLMMVGDSKKLKAKIHPTNATYRRARWSSSNKSVAVVDDTGIITAFSAGSATITATAKDSSNKKSICYIDVRERVSATAITAMDKKLVMVSGEQKAVQVSLTPATSTDGCVWSSDNSAVASVNKKTGRITARSVGNANITVMTDSGKTAVIEITVIGLSVKQLKLEQYTEYTLTVEGTTSAVKWDIDNPKIATVNNGLVSTRSVGSTVIVANVNGRKLKCYLKVVKIN